MANITVVAIDLSKTEAAFSFYEKSFEEQLALMKQEVQVAYNRAKEIDPKTQVVIVWRENGLINPKGFLNRTLTSDEKKLFKKAFLDLTGLQDLYIVAGSISHYKLAAQIKDKEKKSKQIAEGYECFKFVAQLEMARNYRPLKETDYYAYYKRFHDYASDFDVKIQTTNYTFYKNTIIKRKKVAPFYEIPNNIKNKDDECRFIYAFDDKFSTFSINYIEANQLHTISACVEICNEAVLGVADFLIQQKVLAQPFFHFVLSDSLDPETIKRLGVGFYTLNADSDPNASVTLFVKENAPAYPVIEVYRYDPFEKSFTKVEPHIIKESPDLSKNNQATPFK